jgi:Ca-activated chloride channel homolog
MPGRGNWIALFLLLGFVSLPAGQLPVRPLPPPPPDLVVSYVSVTASKGAAPLLSANDFEILEDNKPQKIEYFAVQDRPASVGIVWGAGTGFDAVAPDPDVRECPRVFMKNMPMGSEYFLLSGDKVTTSYTTNTALIPPNFAWSGASSDTVFIGLDILKEAANSRRLLFVVTNANGGGGGQLQQEFLERAAINLGYQIHVVVFIGDPREADLPGQIFLAELSELSGGSFTLSNVSNVLCGNLAKELRLQYMIGYQSSNSSRDGKWRKLSVKVKSPPDGPKLKARIKRGYYALKDRG